MLNNDKQVTYTVKCPSNVGIDCIVATLRAGIISHCQLVLAQRSCTRSLYALWLLFCVTRQNKQIKSLCYTNCDDFIVIVLTLLKKKVPNKLYAVQWCKVQPEKFQHYILYNIQQDHGRRKKRSRLTAVVQSSKLLIGIISFLIEK